LNITLSSPTRLAFGKLSFNSLKLRYPDFDIFWYQTNKANLAAGYFLQYSRMALRLMIFNIHRCNVLKKFANSKLFRLVEKLNVIKGDGVIKVIPSIISCFLLTISLR